MTQTLPGVHFTAPYLLNPLHRIRVDVVGAGGNGSQMVSALARIDSARRAMDLPGLAVTVWDPDTVAEANLGRQLFSKGELGQNKAVALVTRFNRFYGTDWRARNSRFDAMGGSRPNVVISCVDSLAGRREVHAMMEYQKASAPADEDRLWYWMDLGNARRTGQCVLGSADVPQPSPEGVRTERHLPTFAEEFDMNAIDEGESGPSCSLAEALEKQDLFINSSLVQLSGSLLWALLKDGQIRHRGFYVNLEALETIPMTV